MMARITFITVLGLCLFTATLSHADTIALKSGDRLTGTLVDISSGIVSFRTKLAGRIMVPGDQVESLDTDGFLVIALHDETALPGRLIAKDSEFVLVAPDGETHTPIDLAQVRQIESVPESAFVKPEPKPDTSIAVTTGYTLRTGTKDASGPMAKLEVDRTGELVTTELDARVEYTEDADALDRYFDGEVVVSKNNDGGLNPTLRMEVERNRDKALKLGAAGSVGISKDLFEGESSRLSGFAGVGARVEYFDPEPLRGDLGNSSIPASLVKDQDEEMLLDLRLRYTRQLMASTIFDEQLTIQPRLDDPDELRAELESSLSVPLVLNFHLNFDLLFDYDSDPFHESIDKWNTSLSAGLQIEF